MELSKEELVLADAFLSQIPYGNEVMLWHIDLDLGQFKNVEGIDFDVVANIWVSKKFNKIESFLLLQKYIIKIPGTPMCTLVDRGKQVIDAGGHEAFMKHEREEKIKAKRKKNLSITFQCFILPLIAYLVGYAITQFYERISSGNKQPVYIKVP